DPDPPALGVDVGQLRLLGGPCRQRAQEALDQSLALERAEATEDRGLLVEAHPELVARDPQGQFFEAHLFPFSACEHRQQARSSVVPERPGSRLEGMSERKGPHPAKPVIGISAFPRIVETSIGRTLLHTASRFYVESVVRTGCVPVVLAVLDPTDVDSMIGATPRLGLTCAAHLHPSRNCAKPPAAKPNVAPSRHA